MDGGTADCGALSESVVFLFTLGTYPDPAAARESHLSAERGTAALPARGAGRRGNLHGHRTVWREEARPAAALSALRQWHASARPAWRDLCRARRRGISALLRILGSGDDRGSGGSHRHRRQDFAALLAKKKGANDADPHGLGLRRAAASGARADKVEEKSNEIIAIPELLDMLSIEGAIITIDAMGCQREIAKQIVDKEGRLRSRAQRQSGLLARGCQNSSPPSRKPTISKTPKISRHETVDGDHGRIETRNYTVIHDVSLVAGTPRLAGVERRRHGREHARNRGQNREGDTLLHHFAYTHRRTAWANRPQPPVYRE